MNLALPALVVFAIFLPGIIYRRNSTLAGPFRRERSFADEVLDAAVATAVVHLPLIAIISLTHPFGLEVNLRAVVTLLINKPADGTDAVATIGAVVDNPAAIAVYFLTACGFAKGMARCHRAWILSGDSPGRLMPTQFQDEPNARRWAEWEGLFAVDGLSGTTKQQNTARRCMQWGRLVLGGAQPQPTSDVIALVAVVVEFGREPYLYLGLLEDVRFTDDGTLDRIELANAYRRKLEQEASPAEQREQLPRELRDDPLEGFYRVTGRRLILRSGEFKTMNIDYFGVEVIETAAAELEETKLRIAA